MNPLHVHDRQTRLTILRLLSSMGSSKEINQYLKRYSELEAARFAVVKVGGAVLRDDLEALTSSLAFLQDVGLTPIVIHGAGPQLDAAIAEAGIEKRTVDGLRVTRADTLAIVRQVMQAQNLRLVEALQALDTRATSIVCGVFEAILKDEATYGLVGDVSRVDLTPLRASLKAGSIPVIASLGETREGQIVNINADFAANALVREVQPDKIVFLTGTGGLLDASGQVIDSINLSSDYEQLMQAEWINGGMRVKIEQIKALLDTVPLSSSVSITRPAELARELFTHKGSGTLVRRGERVLCADNWQAFDLVRLRGLIESAFGRQLASDYFERSAVARAWVSENYRAAVILLRTDAGIYLDKFAVLDEAQGEGLGRALWAQMRAQTPALYWRSRRHNPVNSFYFDEADGCSKQGEWTVFWYGLDDFSQIERCVMECRQRPATLSDPVH